MKNQAQKKGKVWSSGGDWGTWEDSCHKTQASCSSVHPSRQDPHGRGLHPPDRVGRRENWSQGSEEKTRMWQRHHVGQMAGTASLAPSGVQTGDGSKEKGEGVDGL